MSPMELVIHFKGEKHHVGLENPVDWFVEVGKIMLTVMNPDNKVKVVLDTDFGLKCLLGIHNSMGLTTFEVEVVPCYTLNLQMRHYCSR